MYCTESRFVIGLSNIPFAGAYVCTFQHGNFTVWGGEGVKKTAAYALMCAGMCVCACACVFSGTVKRIDHTAFWVWWDS